MRIGIVTVPYITVDRHLELAKESIKSCVSKEHELEFTYVVNRVRNNKELDEISECQQSKEASCIFNNENCLARAWNLGAFNALSGGCDFVIIPNLDVILHPDCIDNLIKTAIKHPEAILWTAADWYTKKTINEATMEDSVAESPNFSCFMMDRELFKEVGFFNESFKPAYFEDNYMHYQIKKKGQIALMTNSARFYHYASATINSDEKLKKNMSTFFEINKNKYIELTGGLPGEEIF